MGQVLAIVRIGNEWEARLPYEFKWMVKDLGFQWDPGRKGWFTLDPEKPGRLRQMAESRGAKVYAAELPSVQIGPWDGHPSLAVDGPDYPAPPDKEYFPFQKAGIRYALQREKTLIADQPGLGKTVQAIGVMNAEPVKSALIVCPASIRHQWANEIDKWLNYHRTVGIAEKGKLPGANICIISWTMLHRLREKVRERSWDVVVADECHYAKNIHAKRTIALYGDGAGVPPIPCRRFLALTGTPVDNRPIDLYGTLRFMLPDQFPGWWDFTLLYCNGTFKGADYKVTGHSNMKTLGAILRNSCMVRRLKRQVLKQFPPKRRQFFELEADAATKEAVRREMAAYEATCKASHQFSMLGDFGTASTAQIQALQLISAARVSTAMAKVQVAKDILREWIASEKLVVVCYHRKVIDSLLKEFGSAAISLHGGTRDRQGAIDRFISDRSVRLFVMQVEAGGTGVDGLQRVCNHGVMMEMDWRPGKMAQAEDRLWRIGQDLGVLWTYFVLPGSVDQRFLDLNREKAWVSRSLLDDPVHEASGMSPDPPEGHLL